jgi:hypothetical protein
MNQANHLQHYTQKFRNELQYSNLLQLYHAGKPNDSVGQGVGGDRSTLGHGSDWKTLRHITWPGEEWEQATGISIRGGGVMGQTAGWLAGSGNVWQLPDTGMLIPFRQHSY